MAYDAVLRNLAVIGEAVRTLPEETRASMPDVPWASIAGLRKVVGHEYFRVAPSPWTPSSMISPTSPVLRA